MEFGNLRFEFLNFFEEGLGVFRKPLGLGLVVARSVSERGVAFGVGYFNDGRIVLHGVDDYDAVGQKSEVFFLKLTSLETYPRRQTKSPPKGASRLTFPPSTRRS